ncbi:MAG: hypothetical protein RL685_6089 [Pseudomonadota bacterium]|jgi:uncharacterized protein YndB with AHSA1/START domain
MPPAQGRTDTASLVIAAPAEAIYRAFADANVLMAWLPPGNMRGRALEYDFRQGGRYRIELTYADSAPEGGGKTTAQTDVSSGRFLALEINRRIVQTVEFDAADVTLAGEMRMTWSLEPVPAGTRVTITAENVPSGIRQEDHAEGLRSSLENLARFSASAASKAETSPR